jgi:cytochrome bd-type quinol oxidase subunit 2
VEFLFNVLVFLHFIGLASLLGGWLVQMSSSTKVINNAMLHGVLTQVVTGIAMVGLLSSKVVEVDDGVDNTKFGIKLVVALAVLAVVLLGRRKPEDQQKGYWAAAGALTLLNVAVAVFVSFL